MNLVMLSDTHAAHHAPRPSLPAGDVLIHCGDLTHFGSFAELKAEISWLKSQPHAIRILISGNHDTCLENLMAKNMEAELRRMLHPIIYMRDSGVTIGGHAVLGQPVDTAIRWRIQFGFGMEAGEVRRDSGSGRADYTRTALECA